MPGNPFAIAPSEIGSIFSNGFLLSSSYHHQRCNLYQSFGAKVTIQRTLTGKHRWVCSYNEDIGSPTAVDGYRKYDRLLPCPPITHPPRVEHLVVLKEGPVCDYISTALNLPPQYVADLIRFGAVHYALVHPEPPATATPEQRALYENFTLSHLLKQRESLQGKTIREAQKTFRVHDANEYVEVGTYLRVYVHPRRFPRCYQIDWKSRVLSVTESYVVLDKPAGTSVGGTSNNIEETCVNFVTRTLGLTSPLMTTHQIDNCTEGCVVLARSEEFCSVFHRKIRDKEVKKLCLALATSPVSRGAIIHYMSPASRAPRVISEEYMEGWQLCQLEVLDCKKVPWPNTAIEERYQIQDCEWPVKKYAYEYRINLVTGRTHQIRAQFAACGAPIVGDSMYMPAALAELTNPGINPFGKLKREYSCEDERQVAIKNWISLHGKEPTIAIGLQACQISWDDDEHIHEAGSPWWRWDHI